MATLTLAQAVAAAPGEIEFSVELEELVTATLTPDQWKLVHKLIMAVEREAKSPAATHRETKRSQT